jgi:hypothetical protein
MLIKFLKTSAADPEKLPGNLTGTTKQGVFKHCKLR